ncbi:MAG: DUF3300 domain-containing protein [Colwellia sp.]|nr:DUF3300 domain-containing protein [Colwellia sp.]
MKNAIFLLSIATSSLVSFNLFAEQTFAQSNLQEQTQLQEKSFSEAQLAQMLAPIALYPDSLLTHVLIASTYPIEIVEAHRWLIKNDELNAEQAAESVEDFDWDASVKALVPFERILSRLSEDLTWTQQLGDAFLQDESRLLESIQVLRKQAEIAGNLEKMDNMDVSYEDSNIVIEPREKEIVYVPYYDTRMVYGTWHSVSYPPVYWRPHHSVYVSRYNPFYFHSGVHISFNYFFSAFHWHNRHVVVVNSHHSTHRYYEQRPRRLIVNGGYAKRWAHKPEHRKGVAYRTKHTSSKYHNKRAYVSESSPKKHQVVQHKIQRNSHKAQQVINQKTHKRLHNINNNISKKVTKPATKRYASMDKSKKYASQKVHRTNMSVKKVSPKKVTVKTYNKRAHKENSKSHTTITRKTKQSSNYKQKQRTTSTKRSHSKTAKTKNR